MDIDIPFEASIIMYFVIVTYIFIVKVFWPWILA